MEEIIRAQHSFLSTKSFQLNPLVQAATPQAKTRMFAVQLYLDGAPYHQRRVGADSVTGVWLVVPCTAYRFLICPYRKQDICSCGCRGWCSLFIIFRLVRWTLEATAVGKWPASRHDCSRWISSDKLRAVLASQNLNFQGSPINIKTDWAEMTVSLGLTNWSSSSSPCPHCDATKESLYNFDQCSVLGHCWVDETAETYEVACSRCEYFVTLAIMTAMHSVQTFFTWRVGKHLAACVPALIMMVLEWQRATASNQVVRS